MRKVILSLSLFLLVGCGEWNYPAAYYQLEYAVHYPDGRQIHRVNIRSHNSNSAPHAYTKMGRRRNWEVLFVWDGLSCPVICETTCPIEIISFKKLSEL